MKCLPGFLFSRYRRRFGIVLFVFLALLIVLWTQKPDISPLLSPQPLVFYTTRGDLPPHRLAVIVPFRDREDELLVFVPHISKFLNEQRASFKIFVLNQTDAFRFNRAVLINIGFVLSKDEHFDYLAMHDVDLLPMDHRLSYAFPSNGVVHLSSPLLHPLYHYSTFVGGILIIKHADFERINGMSNKYWGWGLEDDEFYTRLRHGNISLVRPKFNSSNAFQHIHDRKKRKRDFRTKIPELHKVDRVTGISTLGIDGEHGSLYSIIRSHSLVVKGYVAAVYDITLNCKVAATPWCLHSNTSSLTKKSAIRS